MLSLRLFLLLLLPLFLSAQPVPVQLFFQPDTVYVEPDATATISLRIKNFTNISNADFLLAWDTNAFQVITVSTGISKAIQFNLMTNTLIASFVSPTGQGQTFQDSAVLLTFFIKTKVKYPFISAINFPTEPLFYRYNAGFDPAPVMATVGYIYIRRCNTTLDLRTKDRFCVGDSVKVTPVCNNCQSVSWNNSSTAPYWVQTTSGWIFATATAPLRCFAHDSLRFTQIPLPYFTLPDTAILCPGTTTTIAPQTSATYQYQWSNSERTQHITVSAPGTYTVKVTNAENCSSTDTIQVIENGPVGLTSTAMQPNCKTAEGAIVLRSVKGGSAPWLFSIDRGKTFTTDTLFNNLPPGPYNPTVQDANGCEYTDSLRLNPAFAPFIAIATPSKSIINTGDSVALRAEIPANYPSNLVQSITWQPKEGLTPQNDLLQAWIKPQRTTTYTVTLRSKDGCIASDSIRLQVRQIGNLRLYIPNAFAPESSSGNQQFMISFEDPRIEKIQQIIIYDRWGNLVFSTHDARNSWDGVFRGATATPGLYTWQIQIRLKDGSTQTLTGDLTLLR